MNYYYSEVKNFPRISKILGYYRKKTLTARNFTNPAQNPPTKLVNHLIYSMKITKNQHKMVKELMSDKGHCKKK